MGVSVCITDPIKVELGHRQIVLVRIKLPPRSFPPDSVVLFTFKKADKKFAARILKKQE